jgi:hypothetical protein
MYHIEQATPVVRDVGTAGRVTITAYASTGLLFHQPNVHAPQVLPLITSHHIQAWID